MEFTPSGARHNAVCANIAATRNKTRITGRRGAVPYRLVRCSVVGTGLPDSPRGTTPFVQTLRLPANRRGHSRMSREAQRLLCKHCGYPQQIADADCPMSSPCGECRRHAFGGRGRPVPTGLCEFYYLYADG